MARDGGGEGGGERFVDLSRACAEDSSHVVRSSETEEARWMRARREPT